jgi:hypothetical protein
VDTTPETPAAQAPELSLEDIVSSEIAKAEATGQPVVAADAKPADENKTPAEETTAEPAVAAKTDEAPAEEPKPDEISAARARKILEKVEERIAAVEARERQLTEREAGGVQGMLSELLRAPKAFLAKHGKHIDDLIDASVSEGTVEVPDKDDNPRLTALEKRIEARERAEQEAQHQAQVDAIKAKIHAEVKAAGKYPLITEAGRAEDVTDFMVEYHAIHGKPISWDRAAFLVEQDLRRTVEKGAAKLGWKQAEAAKPAAQAAAKDRPGTTSIGGAQSTSAVSSSPALPDDPDQLLSFLVKDAQQKASA